MNNIKLNFKHILLGSSALLGLTLSQAYAADEKVEKNTSDDDGVVLEEIIVTGIRGSQMRALQAKRNSDTIIDAIAAEDVGKFPDQNISEALQRIPGITIDRNGGEGRTITVRGLGPATNAVLLNGRVLATENDGREFSFDILPAELINAVDVYKTPNAKLVEGGIGSTVNMKTARPLDYDGFTAAMSAKGIYDTSRGKVSPQFSGLLSDTFVDGKFGILGSFSYVRRDLRTERVYTDGVEANLNLDFDNDGTNELEGVSMPTFAEYDINETERERISGTLALQWQVSEDLLVTVDGLYSKLDVNDNTRTLFFYGGPGEVTNATVDENNTVTHAQGQFQTRIASIIRPRLAKTYQAGFNAEWSPSDNLYTVFDAAYSKSTDNTGGNQAWFDTDLHAPGSDPSQVMFDISPNGLPTFSNFGDLSDTSNATFGWFTWEGRSVSDETFQATLDGDYQFENDGILDSIAGGINYAFREKGRVVSKTPGNIQCLWCGVPFPQELFSTVDASGFLGGGSGEFNTSFPSFNIADMQAWMESDAGINATADPDATRAALATNGNGVGVVELPGDGGVVREKNYGAYIQANFSGSFGEKAWSGNLGLRYTKTDVLSSGVGQEILEILSPPNSDRVVVLSEPVAIQETGSYNVWLPSANVKIDMAEDIVFRAAVAKTLTRATLTDLMLFRNINARERERNINSGNPSLKPLVAWNYDAALTWYVDDVSYVSGAVFHKDLRNNIARKTTVVEILGEEFFSNRPENEGEGSLTGFELQAQHTFSNLPAPFDGLGAQANFTSVYDGENNSKTYNIVGFYEKGPIQARLAYNFRDGYTLTDSGKRGQPEMIRAYGQWDASASYDVTDGVSIFLEAINITNARTLWFSKFENRVIEYADNGSRYSIGARVRF